MHGRRCNGGREEARESEYKGTDRQIEIDRYSERKKEREGERIHHVSVPFSLPLTIRA